MDGKSQAVLDDCWNRIGVRGDQSCAELVPHIHCRNCPVFSAAARTLLDVPAPAAFVQSATEHFARPVQAERDDAAGADMQSVVVFRLRTEWYAMRTVVCVEIADLRPIRSLPHRRDAAVLGVVNVRGTLMVCISLPAILGATDSSEIVPASSRRRASVARLLVAWVGSGAVVFPVDEVHGVERLRTADLKAVPATVAHAQVSYTKALMSLDGRRVGLLDERRLFSKVEGVLA
jgi:chemotaxis-related protein WspD